MSNYFGRVALAFDQMVNAILGGWPDESFSARCYRQRHKRRFAIAMAVANKIFFWQNNHCRGAYDREKKRAHIAPEYADQQPTTE